MARSFACLIWFKNESRLPQTRLAVISYAIVGLMALLLLGFWKLQIVDSDRYAQLAERNRIRTIPIIAPRGSMLDREGRVLVDNYPSFSVLLLRDDPSKLQRNCCRRSPTDWACRSTTCSSRSTPRNRCRISNPSSSSRKPRPRDIAFIESHRADVPVLEMLMVHRRRYPRGGFMAHVSGYVGEVSADQIEASNGRYKPGDIVGKTGLEKQYNEQLMGVDGQRRVIVNSVGREVGRLEQTDAIPGKPIQLTIDYDLQAVAEQDLAGKKGAVVALNPQHRRNSGDGQPAFLRSQRLRRAHFQRGMAAAQRRSRPSADGPRHPGATGARLRFQDFHDHGDAGIQGDPGGLSRSSARDTPNSTAAPFTTPKKEATARWICTRPS